MRNNRRPLWNRRLYSVGLLLSALALLVSVLSLASLTPSTAQSPGLPPYPPQASAARLLFPSSIETGEITSPIPTIRYLFLANAKDRVEIAMTRTGGTLTPRLKLFDANGSLVQNQSANLAGNRADLKLTISERGWYFLEATSETGLTTGTYGLEASGFSPEIYALLPVGEPALPKGARAILRGGIYTMGKAGNAEFLTPMQTGQGLSITLSGKGDQQISVSSESAPTPDSKQGGNIVSFDYSATGTGWVKLAVKTSSDRALLTIVTKDASGAPSTLVPESLTELAQPTVTFTPTFTDTPTITPTPIVCAGFGESRLKAGIQARITPGFRNILRSQPSRSSKEILRIPAGEIIRVLEGPVCTSDGIAWWKVDYSGNVGWTAEGQKNEFFIEPLTDSGAETNIASAKSLGIGVIAKVIVADEGLKLREGTSTDLGILENLPFGSLVTLIGGPQDNEGYRWWQVMTANRGFGWVVESADGINTLAPQQIVMDCPGMLPSRMKAGGTGFVALDGSGPNALNSLPIRPSTDSRSSLLRRIPPNKVFNVIAGPVCGEYAWWLVRYDGAIGWTAEGEGNVYWLVPQ